MTLMRNHYLLSNICQVARETNEELRSFKAAPGEGFDVGAILAVAKRYVSFYPE